MRLLVLVAFSATVSVAAGHAAQEPRAGQDLATDRQTHTLRLGTSGTLDVSTLSGDISVSGGTGPATVEVIRHVRDRPAADARAALDRVSISIDDRPDRARIRAIFPGDRERSNGVTVSFNLVVPIGTALSARTLSGTVVVTGVHGDVSATTLAGDVTLTGVRHVTSAHTLAGTVTIADVDQAGALELESVGGNVVLTHIKAARVTATTIGGAIRATDVAASQVTLKTLSGLLAFTGPLVRGGRYQLQAQSGRVQFAPAPGVGYDLDVHTFSGEIQVDPALGLRRAGSPTRNLTGTVGDGAASVAITTFSGAVTIGSRR